MSLVPQYRAVFGVDVVGSASTPGHSAHAVPDGVEQMVSEALRTSGIAPTDAVEWEPGGDGALITFPSEFLGGLLDATQRLDVIAMRHNRRHKPELRFRAAIDVGPVGGSPGFSPPKITASRLLESKEFKDLMKRCQDESGEDAANTALIVSAGAGNAAFGGDHTSLVRRGDFADLGIQNKEYEDTAWVRVPGFDARSLREFSDKRTKAPEAPYSSGVTNVAYGVQNGVQAGTVNGGVNIGRNAQ